MILLHPNQNAKGPKTKDDKCGGGCGERGIVTPTDGSTMLRNVL